LVRPQLGGSRGGGKAAGDNLIGEGLRQGSPSSATSGRDRRWPWWAKKTSVF